MDKAFKIEKEQLVSNFKVACDKLEYQDVEINPVTDSITYKAIGKGLQWGTNAIIKVTFIEKGGYTNASFQVLKEIRFPMVGKQRIIDSFYKEIFGLVEVLNKSSITNISIEKADLNLVGGDSDKGDSSVETNQIKNEFRSNTNRESETVKKYLEENKKNNNNKLFIVIGIAVVLGIFILINGGKENPCDCVEVFFKKDMVGYEGLPGNFKNKYNKCVNSWDNINEANKGCVDKVIKDDRLRDR
jgi:hypothetical protein